MNEYKVCVGTVIDEAGKEHTTYGVELWQLCQAVRVIPDVSLDEASVRELVRLCNELELDPIHLDDVVEDFLI